MARYSPRPTIRQFMSLDASPKSALLFSRWFLPEFVERGGCVLNADRFDDDSLVKWRSTGVPNASIEAVINRLDPRDEWPNDTISDEICTELVQVLARTWYAALDEQFPDRTFIVLVGTDDPPTDITVFQSGPG